MAANTPNAAVYSHSVSTQNPGNLVDKRKEIDMKSQILGLRIASAIFGLITLAQLARLLIRPEVLVAGHVLPLWPSVLAVVILGSLSLWLCRLSTLHTDEKV